MNLADPNVIRQAAGDLPAPRMGRSNSAIDRLTRVERADSAERRSPSLRLPSEYAEVVEYDETGRRSVRLMRLEEVHIGEVP